MAAVYQFQYYIFSSAKKLAQIKLNNTPRQKKNLPW